MKKGQEKDALIYMPRIFQSRLKKDDETLLNKVNLGFSLPLGRQIVSFGTYHELNGVPKWRIIV